MNMFMDRRDFLATMAVSAATLSLSKFLKTAPRLIVGHTGITWGYAPPNAAGAVKDVGSLGFRAFESFGSVLDYWDSRGGLKAQLDRVGVPLRGAYCPFDLTESSKRTENLANATKWGKLITANGGAIAVVGPNAVRRATYDFSKSRSQIVSTLNEIGQALADVGVTGALHPHSGSCVQTSDEVYAVMNAVDTRVMFLTPDTGELTAGGADPLPIIRDFLPIIRHAHLKDYDGGETHDGFCPLGKGRVDIKGAIEALEKTTGDVALMVELNPSVRPSGMTPLETARTSKQFLQALGYTFKA